MGTMVQIIYISRSTSAPQNAAQGVDPVVSRILAKSRTNNRKNGLTGVLYFGNGCFFQCLEGEEHAIDALYARLEQDERHRDLKLLSRTTIASPQFQEWSMKYVPAEKEMTALLQRHGFSDFDPYRFDADLTRSVVALLRGTPEPAAAAQAPIAVPAALPVAKAAAGVSKALLALAGLILLAIGFALGKMAG